METFVKMAQKRQSKEAKIRYHVGRGCHCDNHSELLGEDGQELSFPKAGL
jgi:hypothetical protein